MDVVAHDYIFVKLESFLFAIVAQDVDHEQRHAVGLEYGALVDCVGRDKERPYLLGGESRHGSLIHEPSAKAQLCPRPIRWPGRPAASTRVAAKARREIFPLTLPRT